MVLKRIIEILKTFDKAELKKFERFVRSGYFNTNEGIIKLLRSLKKFHPSFNDPTLTNEYMFRKVYGARKFDNKTFSYLLSELFKLTKKFISISNIETDNHEMNMVFIRELVYKKLFSQARSHIEKMEKEEEKNFVIGSTYLQNKVDVCLLWHIHSYFSSAKLPYIHKDLEGGEFKVYETIIDLCHIYQNLIAIRNSFNVDYEDNLLFSFIRNFNYKGMLDEVERLDSNDKRRSRLLNAFRIYLCFMITFLDEKDEIYFQKMRDIVKRYQDDFKTEELRDIHVMLTNCCKFKAKAIDNERYKRYSFEIIQNALAKNLYLSQGQYMLFTTYFFILNNALDLNEVEWAEVFVETYIKHIAPEIRNDVENYSKAEILFRKKQIETVLDLLSRVKYKYTLIKPNVRCLTLMTYYELDHIDEAYSLIDSHAHFISNNKKITPEQKTADSNFLAFTKKILKQKEKGEYSPELEETINQCSSLNRKEWLLEKINDLKINLSAVRKIPAMHSS